MFFKTTIWPLVSEQSCMCQVIRRANRVRYGLCATLWTENASRVHRIAPKLEVCPIFFFLYLCTNTFLMHIFCWNQNDLCICHLWKKLNSFEKYKFESGEMLENANYVEFLFSTEKIIPLFFSVVTLIYNSFVPLWTSIWIPKHCEACLEFLNSIVYFSYAHAFIAVHHRYFTVYVWGIQTYGRQESDDGTYFSLGVCLQYFHHYSMHYSSVCC